MGRPTILLADDDRDFLQALQTLLASEFEVVETVEDGCALVEAAMARVPDVIITDISMPLLNGIRAARQLKACLPNTPVIFLTVREDPVFVAEAKKMGVSGYIVKRSAASDLVPAIRAVLQGGGTIASDAQDPEASLDSFARNRFSQKEQGKTRKTPSSH